LWQLAQPLMTSGWLFVLLAADRVGDVGLIGGFGEPVRRSGVFVAVAATPGPTAGRVVASDAPALGTGVLAGILAPEKVTVLK
jgi:hypothetical protein